MIRSLIRNKRGILSLFLIVGLILFLVACKKEEPVAVEPEPEPEEVIEIEEPEVEEEVFAYTAPLTGIGTNEELPKRIFAVMINNLRPARPQSGIDQADIVYEVLSEGWITRFVSLFHSQQPEVIGPVRSLRPYHIDIALGYDAVMAHAGGSPQALNTVASRGLASLDDIYGGGGAFYRVSFRQMPHNLYTSYERLVKGAENRRFREDGEIPTLLFKKADEPMQGETAEKIEIIYHSTYKAGYEYDPETQVYSRLTNDEEHLEMETEQQLTMTNILVIEAPHRIVDNEGRREIDVTGKGRGLLFQRGQVVEVDWEFKDGVIRPFINGEEQGLYPGKTWINIIPDNPGVKINVLYDKSESDD